MWPDRARIPRPGTLPPDDPRNAAWRALLPDAAALVAGAGGRVRFDDLTAGGGSMLAARYGHRRSRDLDLFLADPQLLGALSPRLNDAAAGIAPDYEEASNFLKFRIGDSEIDVVVAAPVLGRPPTAMLDLGAGRIGVEPPGEIIAKKLLYRAAGFTLRDAFDLATVAALEPEELAGVAARVGGRALLLVADRLLILAPLFTDTGAARLHPYPGFADRLPACHAIASAAVATLRSEAAGD